MKLLDPQGVVGYTMLYLKIFWSDPMWLKQYHKPPMTGNGLYIYTTYQNGEIGDGLLLFYQH